MATVNQSEWLNDITFNSDGLVPAIAQDKATGRILMMAWMNAESLQLTVTNNIAVYYSRSRQQLWRKGESSGHTQIVHNIYLDCDADVIVLSITQVGGIACHTGRASCFYKELTLVDDAPSWHVVEPVLKNPNDIYHNNCQNNAQNVAQSNAQNNGTDENQSMNQDIVDTSVNSSVNTIVQSNNTVENTTQTISILEQLDSVLQERKQARADSSYVASLYSKGLNKVLEKVGEESVETIIAAKEYQHFNEKKASSGHQQYSSTNTVNDDVHNDGNDARGTALHNDLVYEVADVWFHTLITLAWFDINSQSVLDELARRFGLSGIEEKNSRSK